MTLYRAIGPKHDNITEGKVYELTETGGTGFEFLDDDGDERWVDLTRNIHCERFEIFTGDSPVRTVTRREIVAGRFDGLTVGEVVSIPDCEYTYDLPENALRLTLDGAYVANDIDRIIAHLTAIAEALREG